MIIKQFPVGPFQMNAYIIHNEKADECLLIDPGDDLHILENYLEQKKLVPQAIFNTHAHIDHVRMLSIIQKKYDLPFYLAKEELPLLENLQNQGAMFGIETAEPPHVTNYLSEDEEYNVAGLSFSTIHTPGHSPGSICFLFEKDLIAGDVLFYDSIGRTDLYMGNYEQLIDSIKTKLMVLDDSIRVHPGHGPSTTIGRERAHNPFLV
ncbi:MAG: MBL fold metallo-hydrolase [Calditrichae bacterium]|nr:MBL fold metallo-hydrolase [Calditrichia bacterium]